MGCLLRSLLNAASTQRLPGAMFNLTPAAAPHTCACAREPWLPTLQPAQRYPAAFYAQTGCGAGHPLEGLPEEAYLGASTSTRGLYAFMIYTSVFFAVRPTLPGGGNA